MNFWSKFFSKTHKDEWYYSCAKTWEDEFTRVMLHEPVDLTNETTDINGEFEDYLKRYTVSGSEVITECKNGIITMTEHKGKRETYGFRTIIKDDDRTLEVAKLYEETNHIKATDINEAIIVYSGSDAVKYGGLPIIKKLYPNVSCCCDVCLRKSECEPIDIRVCRSLQKWRELTKR